MQAPARDPTSIVASTYHGVEVGARRGLVARPLCRPLIEGSPTHFLLGAVCLSVTDVVRDGAAWCWCWCWCWGVGWMAVQTKNGWCVSQGNGPPLQPSLGWRKARHAICIAQAARAYPPTLPASPVRCPRLSDSLGRAVGHVGAAECTTQHPMDALHPCVSAPTRAAQASSREVAVVEVPTAPGARAVERAGLAVAIARLAVDISARR